MGTFHQGKSELHGITVVVDTEGPEIYVGRCDDEDEDGVLLHDADVHRAEEGGRSKAEYLRAAALYGVFKKHERLFIPRREVTSIRRLGDLSAD
jgi:hypothetical protein